MKFSPILFLGSLVLISGLVLRFSFQSEYAYDATIRTKGRLGKMEFLREIEKGSANIIGMPTQLPICIYRITDSETGSVHILPGECSSKTKSPTEMYYLEPDNGHNLLRVNSIWTRQIILIPGIIFCFFSTLFLYVLTYYFKSRSRTKI